jgi:hypothetical protein
MGEWDDVGLERIPILNERLRADRQSLKNRYLSIQDRIDLMRKVMAQEKELKELLEKERRILRRLAREAKNKK